MCIHSGAAWKSVLQQTVSEAVSTASKDLTEFIQEKGGETQGSENGEGKGGASTSGAATSEGGAGDSDAMEVEAGSVEEAGQDAYDTFGLAWDWLDLSRVIYTKYIEEDPASLPPLEEPVERAELEAELANVHEALGEHSLETGTFLLALAPA